jgi:hypothetical protein
MTTKAKKAAATPKKRAGRPTFDSTALIKKLLSDISERGREVLTLRFGLGTSATRETLESIGERWSITRERVRQIEASALEAVRGSKAFKDAEKQFAELCTFVESLGAIIPEEHLLEELASDEKGRNRFRFLLVVGSAFFRERETDEFYARWHVDHATAKKVHKALSSLYSSLSDTEVLKESDLFSRFIMELKEVETAYRNEEVLKRWLSLSKNISSNPLSEWGKAHAPAIRTKGIRDYAYLVIKRAGSPMHFRDVANSITELFAKKAHVATTHNELMKDERFVLVGRGLYALSEWGYRPGVVRDVVRDVLKEHGSLTRDQIVKEVKKVRYVKDNTILVNLSDPKYFKRNKNGTYSLS